MSEQRRHQCSLPKPSITAAAAAEQDDGEESSGGDDFKPDMRRRPRCPESPSCDSRKKARLSADKTVFDETKPPQTRKHILDAVGQLLLCWDDSKEEWEFRVISDYNSSKVKNITAAQLVLTQLLCQNQQNDCMRYTEMQAQQ